MITFIIIASAICGLGALVQETQKPETYRPRVEERALAREKERRIIQSYRIELLKNKDI